MSKCMSVRILRLMMAQFNVACHICKRSHRISCLDGSMGKQLHCHAGWVGEWVGG